MSLLLRWISSEPSRNAGSKKRTQRTSPAAGQMRFAGRAAGSRFAELIRGCFFRRFLALHQFHVQAKRLQLADQYVERFGHARLDARFALDDGLVNFRAAVNVVRL